MKLLKISEHKKLPKECENIDFSISEIKFNSLKLLNNEKQDNGQIKRAGYKIGYCWCDENIALYVAPKEDEGKRANFQKMFEECLEDKEIAEKITAEGNKIYELFLEEPKIEIKSKNDEITIILIMHFLILVENIVKKGLKKGYIDISENLSGKIKGKISIKETIRRNHFKSRLDKTVCNFQKFTVDCIENRILKLALYKSKLYINKYKNFNNFEKLENILAFNMSAFEFVSLTDINLKDFKKVKHSPFYQEYKYAIKLAYTIFRKLGFSLYEKKDEEIKNSIYPFYIDMSKLFELYVELKLKEAGISNISSQEKINISKECEEFGMKEIRPDFLVSEKKWILDAKYKYWFKDEQSSRFKDDFSQIALYGRSKGIRDHLKLEDGEIPSLIFVYPTLEKEYKNIPTNLNPKEEDKCFYKLYKMKLTIP